MASVYRRTRYADVPPEARIVGKRVRGKTKRVAVWLDEHGKEQSAEVVTTRPGRDRIIVSVAHKYTVVFTAEDGRREVSGYSDRDASLALGRRLEKEAARRREGLVDEVDDQAKRSVWEHLDDFMDSRPSTASNEWTGKQVRNRITRVLNGTGTSRLHRLRTVSVERFFQKEQIADYTRNEYVSSLKAFTRWAEAQRRIERDPLAELRLTPRSKIKPKHPRRAVTMEEMGKLLEAARRRPLDEALTVRRGPNKGKKLARVRDSVKANLRRLGEERVVCYLLAFWAGLRRTEIARLRWGDIRLDDELPRIQLRRETTKAKRADNVILHPQLVDQLRQFQPAQTHGSDHVVGHVPSMKVVRADLAAAGIPYQDEHEAFFDFHAARMSVNTALAVRGVDGRIRQSHMRHTKRELTETTYMDAAKLLGPVAEQIRAVPPIPFVADPEKAPKQPEDEAGRRPAPILLLQRHCQRAPGSSRHPAAHFGHEVDGELVDLTPGDVWDEIAQALDFREDLTPYDKTRHLLAPGLQEKRVKGFEPSTFTLAMMPATMGKARRIKSLAEPPPPPSANTRQASLHRPKPTPNWPALLSYGPTYRSRFVPASWP